MKTIETIVYEYDELGEEAKEKARTWFLEGMFDDEWHDRTYEDAKTIGLKIQAFDVSHRTIEGHLTMAAAESIKLVLENHGKMCDTYKLAKTFKRGWHTQDEYEKALLEEYLSILRKEYDYMLTNEYVEEGIRAYDYTFTASGKRF